jgi:hypothetical protein
MSSLREDLALISGISESDFDKTIDLVSSGSTDNKDFAVFIESYETDEQKEPIIALFRFFNYIGETLAEARSHELAYKKLDELLQKVVANDLNAAKGWVRLKGAYDKLQPFFIKAKEDVIKSRFSRVSDFSLTVDLRPVYSLDRNTIVKLLYPNILKIETNDDKTFICELDEENLDLLLEEITLAKKKLELLKNKVHL